MVALTPELRVDRSFGPKSARPTIRVKPIRRDRFVLRLRVRANAPGLLAVRVKNRRGHLLAAGLAPVHRAGRQTVRIRATGRRGAARRVSGTFRDLQARTVSVR